MHSTVDQSVHPMSPTCQPHDIGCTEPKQLVHLFVGRDRDLKLFVSNEPPTTFAVRFPILPASAPSSRATRSPRSRTRKRPRRRQVTAATTLVTGRAQARPPVTSSPDPAWGRGRRTRAGTPEGTELRCRVRSRVKKVSTVLSPRISHFWMTWGLQGVLRVWCGSYLEPNPCNKSVFDTAGLVFDLENRGKTSPHSKLLLHNEFELIMSS